MSTLVAQTISNGTVSTSSANVIQGSAKAWVNFGYVSSAVTTRASYNVSSITRNGTGIYTINFTNAFADANYSVIGSCQESVPQDNFYARYFSIDNASSSDVRVLVSYPSNLYDAEGINVAIFR